MPTTTNDPTDILEQAIEQAQARLSQPVITTSDSLEKVVYIARCLTNRAGVRLILTCALAKIHRPELDIRKPYTEIGGTDSFSGRNDYDEAHVGQFATKHQLPVNTTTAFLTPGFRTINVPLSPALTISGRPKRMYVYTIALLDEVYKGRLTASDLLVELLRQLLLLKHEQAERMQQLLETLQDSAHGIPLSSEDIVSLIEQHLKSPKSSRLPVLVVAAAYSAASKQLGEQPKPLHAHTAADRQTGALGDLEIRLIDDEQTVTSYEMKAKEVTKQDIDLALQKVAGLAGRVDNYIFITTAKTDKDVIEYATSLYRATGGIEFAVLDCIGFLRHFLHLFHRIRFDFLEAYQTLLLQEPDSAISQPLKEAFLALRRAAEIDSSV
ncbi:restriction endonuclease, SacI family [Anaerolineales bacterium HSG6]|nr:restriction endonuclease, SacI family [Anaerolineales bacterium HSG6]